eukprot:TRINITY_DN7928_c2_g1_i5.p1 TRINITY_DN7928_c2_g1~~TRINITY_DN7928_c2_g1_i5.p1  ORF type:complete len:348 (-),score=81.11 TRINITY_DN7928_c2_g1_i5:269-1312(-)
MAAFDRLARDAGLVAFPEEQEAPTPEAESGGVLHMTPLEVDAQLQVAEVLFRNLIQGKRVSAQPKSDIDSNAWCQNVLGKDWTERNNLQKEQVKQRIQENGENTPFWVEALHHVGELAFEVFEIGNVGGERVRKLQKVDRREVIQILKELRPKVDLSYYARCGAGHELVGLRASVAAIRLFCEDSEVLGECIRCLRLIITDQTFNRDGLAAITVPMRPDERREGHIDRGWSFLRAALDAFAIQAGADPFSKLSDDEGSEEPVLVPSRSQEVALQIADCIVAAKGAPAMRAQIGLLSEELPEDAPLERKELKEMLPSVFQKAQELAKSCPQNEALETFLAMLRRAGAA